MHWIKRSHPPCGGCGLKYKILDIAIALLKSPSMRRVWVEISPRPCVSMYIFVGAVASTPKKVLAADPSILCLIFPPKSAAKQE